MPENKCLTSNRAGVVMPVVDFNRCEGEDACVAVCPYDVFEGVTERIASRLDMPAHPRVERVERAELFMRYGLHSDDALALLLVRLDGFVAWRGNGLDVAACRAALGRLPHTA